MELQNPYREFYDSHSDDPNEFNTAFIESPDKSFSYLLDNSSLNGISGMLVYKEEQEKVSVEKVNNLSGNKDRVELPCQGNEMKSVCESSLKSDLKQFSVSNSAYLDKNEKNWVSSAKRGSKPRYDLDQEIEIIQFSEISETANLSKFNEEKPECIFLAACREEFEKAPKEYDRKKMEKRSFFEMDDENEKAEPKSRFPFSRSDYEYHALSTISEIDSVFTDESVESSMKHKFLDTNGSLDFSIQPKASTYSSANVMKVIQKQHFEKLLQEPGILEESDLTLITTDFDSMSKISEISPEKDRCYSFYKITRFDDEQ